MINRKTPKGLGLLLVSFLVLSVSACSMFTSEPEMSNAEACVKLKALIADHGNNFKEFKGTRKNTHAAGIMQTWNAERVFPLAKNCQVWEWSSGLTNYYCHWAESDEAEARASFHRGSELVNQCLGKQWFSRFVNTKSGGGNALFYQKEGKTVISLRYFKESRTIFDNWKTTLYVGDESNLKAEVQ